MRRFSIVNANGEEYNVTDNINNVLFTEVAGLGINRNDTYRAVGNRFVRVTKANSLDNITGNIYFYGKKPYSQYREFTRFASVEPLKLKYTPEEDGYTYFVDVNMPKLDKGEISKDNGALVCSVTFNKISLYYRELTVITEGLVDAGRYSFSFPVIWDNHKTNRFRSANTMNVIVDSDSYEDCPCTLIIDGPVKNPSWAHYLDGNEYSSGQVSCEVPSGYKLVVDSIGDMPTIRIYDSTLTHLYMDVYQESDFATDRFIYLGHGRNSIQVSSDFTDPVTVRLDARLSYATV